MNILLWVLQVLLALHTAAGAMWKFSNSEQTVLSLKAIPHGLWVVLSVVEVLCSIGFILPLFNKQFGKLAPISAVIIAAEMLLFAVVLLFSNDVNFGHLVYWFVVAVVCTFVAYGRFVAKPL